MRSYNSKEELKDKLVDEVNRNQAENLDYQFPNITNEFQTSNIAKNE